MAINSFVWVNTKDLPLGPHHSLPKNKYTYVSTHFLKIDLCLTRGKRWVGGKYEINHELN